MIWNRKVSLYVKQTSLSLLPFRYSSRLSHVCHRGRLCTWLYPVQYQLHVCVICQDLVKILSKVIHVLLYTCVCVPQFGRATDTIADWYGKECVVGIFLIAIMWCIFPLYHSSSSGVSCRMGIAVKLCRRAPWQSCCMKRAPSLLHMSKVELMFNLYPSQGLCFWWCARHCFNKIQFAA